METDAQEMELRETAIKQIWQQLSACHKFMMNDYPTLWDAYWYGTLTCMFQQIELELGDKELWKILGKKKLERYREEREQLLDGMYDTCHREDYDEDEPELPQVFSRWP